MSVIKRKQKTITGMIVKYWRLPTAIMGGALSSLAYPSEGLWPMIFVAVIAMLLAVRGATGWRALSLGFISGFFFYATQIDWISLYLGPVPLIALSLLEASFFAVGMLTISKVWRFLDGLKNTWLRPLQIAGSVATLWTAREWVSGNFPYGGFPWSRLAMSQSESVLAKWVFFGGQPLLSFLVAGVCALLIAWLFQARTRSLKPTIVSIITIATVFVIPALVNLPTAAERGTLVIAAVQGNAKAGIFSNSVRGSILKNHLNATRLIKTEPLANEIDVVLWPENASDINPLSDASAGGIIRRLVDKELGVPLIFGTITERDGKFFNSSIIWNPNLGVVDWYDKQRPVPFAEYVPDRGFWYSLAPDLVGLISREYAFGTRDGIFELGERKLGILICFEIAIDDIARQLVNSGAQVILSQTNNSDFGRSDETFQQIAIARLRAIETGRALINDSTVGVSAVFAPNGTIIKQLPIFEPGVMVTRVPLRDSLTPAMVIGPVFNVVLNLSALALIFLPGTKHKLLVWRNRRSSPLSGIN